MVMEKKVLKCHTFIYAFLLLQYFSLRKERGLQFEYNLIPLTQGCFVLSLVGSFSVALHGEEENVKSYDDKNNVKDVGTDDQNSLLEPQSSSGELKRNLQVLVSLGNPRLIP